jgi:hypothetical protein
VSLNTKPVIKSIDLDKNTIVTANNDSSTSSGINYSVAPKMNIIVNKAGKLSVGLRCVGSSSAIASWGPFSIAANSTLSFSAGDIQSYIRDYYKNEDLICTFYFNIIDDEMSEEGETQGY